MPALVTAAPPITNPIINNTPIFIRCNGYVQYPQKELTLNLTLSLVHLQHYISNNLTNNMSTIAPVTNDLPNVVTPREGFNIVDEHPMWKDYPSDDEDEEHQPIVIEDLDTSDDEYVPLTIEDLNTDDQPQPLTMADLDTDDQPQPLTMADLDVSGIEPNDDDSHIINLQTVFDDEQDPDIIDPILTDTDDSDWEHEYEDDDEEEEYAQRDDIEDDTDYLEFLNMKRMMQDKETITKPVWRYRRELLEYGLFTCKCESNADINDDDIDVATDCKDKCFIQPEGLFALAFMHYAIGESYYRHRKQLEAEHAYEMAIALSPDNAPCYLEYAQIQETCHDNNQKAEQAYIKAIDIHENVLAMYNLASLHLRLRGFTDECESEIQHEHLDKAIHYYSMACDCGDSASSDMVCTLLYKSYPEKVEEFAYRFNQLGNNKSHYPQCDKAFNSLLEEIGPINLYERLKDAPHGKYTALCLAQVASHRDVSPFVAKVALFTRLNYVTECGICYDEKLNIDLQCGHTTCTDCYKRVYMNECPFCRFEFH